MSSNQELIQFTFETGEIRSLLDANGVAWFIASDVFSILDIAWRGQESLANIKETWKGVRKLRTPRGEQNLIIIAEAAVYKLAFRSNKPEAERFTDRVAEIVVELRKTDSYSMPDTQPNALPGDTASETSVLNNVSQIKRLSEIARAVRAASLLVRSMYPQLDDAFQTLCVNRIVQQEIGVNVLEVYDLPEVNKHTINSGSRFLVAIQELLATGQAILLPKRTPLNTDPKAIGWLSDDGSDSFYLHPDVSRQAANRLFSKDRRDEPLFENRRALFMQLNKMGALASDSKTINTLYIVIGGHRQGVLHLKSLKGVSYGK